MDPFHFHLGEALKHTTTKAQANQGISLFSLRKDSIRKKISTNAVEHLKKGQIMLSDQLLGDLDSQKYDSFETSLWFLGQWRRGASGHEWYINIEEDLIATHALQPEWVDVIPKIMYDPHLKHHIVTTRAPDVKTARVNSETGNLEYEDMPFKVDFTVYFPVIEPADLQEPGIYYYIDSPDHETVYALYVDREGRAFSYNLQQKAVELNHEIDVVELLDNGEAFFVLLKYEPCLESDSKRQRIC